MYISKLCLPKCIKTLQQLLHHLDNSCLLPRGGGRAGCATDVTLNPGKLTGHPANIIHKQGINMLTFFEVKISEVKLASIVSNKTN